MTLHLDSPSYLPLGLGCITKDQLPVRALGSPNAARQADPKKLSESEDSLEGGDQRWISSLAKSERHAVLSWLDPLLLCSCDSARCFYLRKYNMSTCFLGVSTSKTCRLHRVPHFSLSRLKHAHLPRLFRVASAALPVSKRGAALPASSRGCFAWQVPTSTLAGCALAASAVSRGRRATSAAAGRN